MSGKLGSQTQRLDRAVLDFCLRAKVGVFKSIAPQRLDYLRELKAALPGCTFIYRPMLGQPLDDPARNAREAYDAMMPHLAEFPYDYAEGFNETGLWGEANAYNDFTVHLAGLLHQTGQKLLAYSFSVGNPPGPSEEELPYKKNPALWMQILDKQWRVYHDGLRAADGLALHQYKLPPHDDKFTLLRHRLVKHILPPDLKAKPIYLTEFGLDDEGKPGKSGWRGSSWNWTAEQYARWLQDSWREIRNEVAGAAVFVVGHMGWPSFEHVDQPVIADAMRQVNEEEEEMLPDWITDIRDEVNYDTGLRRTSAIGITVHHDGIICPWQNSVEYLKRGTGEGNYTFGITPEGQVIYLNSLRNVVWHARDGYNGKWNRGGVAVLLFGFFMGKRQPTKAQFASFRRLRKWLLSLEAFPVGEEIIPHKDAAATACPGDWWAKGAPPPEELLQETQETELQRLRRREANVRRGSLAMINHVKQGLVVQIEGQSIEDYLRGGE